MRVFVTGATGFIGLAVVRELIDSGHEVVGLARSDNGAAALVATGARVHRGSIEDIDGLRDEVTAADAVIHTAFGHDFTQYIANCERDRHVIEALGAMLAGSGRHLIVTSGTGLASAGATGVSTEDDPPVSAALVPRAATEEAAAQVLASGVSVSIVRLPQVHDRTRAGLISFAIRVARDRGVSAYVGDGANRWPASHRLDTARLYRLALERAVAGATYHAVAEEGVPMKRIAEVLGRGMCIPVVSIPPDDASAHFGWLGAFAGRDVPASSAKTRQVLNWTPTGPDLLTDLEHTRFEDV